MGIAVAIRHRRLALRIVRFLHGQAFPRAEGKTKARSTVFGKPGLRDKVRITIGTSQENNALLGGIKARLNVPILTDIHETAQAAPAAEPTA